MFGWLGQAINKLVGSEPEEEKTVPEDVDDDSDEIRQHNKELLDVKYVGVDTSEELKCMREYRVLKRRGQGGYGAISQVCNKDYDCRFIMKVQKKSENAFKEFVISAQVYKPFPWLTPKLNAYWDCGDQSFTVMEAFNGDMSALGRKQAEQKLDRGVFPAELYTLLYTTEQLLTMFAIAQILSLDLDIVHGDLKPDNFLYKGKGVIRIAVADFGMAGFDKGKMATLYPPRMGFTSNGYFECPTGTLDSKHPWFPYAQYINMFQLQTILIQDGAVIQTGLNSFQRFAGIRDETIFPKDIQQALILSCKGKTLWERSKDILSAPGALDNLYWIKGSFLGSFVDKLRKEPRF